MRMIGWRLEGGGEEESGVVVSAIGFHARGCGFDPRVWHIFFTGGDDDEDTGIRAGGEGDDADDGPASKRRNTSSTDLPVQKIHSHWLQRELVGPYHSSLYSLTFGRASVLRIALRSSL